MPIKHKVAQGECLESIAFEQGLPRDKIWADSANDQLRKKRANPDLLLPGDELTIPDKERGVVSSGTDTRHRFRRKGVPVYFKVQMLDEALEPRPNLDYRFIVGGETREGNTDENGQLVEPVSPTVGEVTVVVREHSEDVHYVFELGALDPDDEITGWQQRLNNLGFYCGDDDGVEGELTKAAVTEFQRNRQLEVTGKFDNETVDALKAKHSS